MRDPTRESATREPTGRPLRRTRRNYRARRVEFLQPAAGILGAGAVCELADATGAEVVYLVGDRLSTIGPIRRFADPSLELPAGWHEARQGHYLHAPAPAWRFEHEDGRRLAIMRAASYFGEAGYTADEAALAWRRLEHVLGAHFSEGRLLATPATTGRYLLGRCVAYGREWPTLSTEHQELIRSTSGQGRAEVIDRGAREADLFELDARLAYAACARELGAGEPTRDSSSEYAGAQRGRYYVEATVPSDWRDRCACGAPGHEGIGLLPHADKGGAWSFPSEPRAMFRAWVDGSEFHVAIRHGWRLRILERLLFPWPPYPGAFNPYTGRVNKRGPLDVWAQTLGELRSAESNALVRAALRMVVLTGIGALQGRPYRSTHSVSVYDADELADRELASLERADDYLVYELEAAAPAWAEMAHPEWAAAIWARQRARLLSAPGGVGALHVPAREVVAFRTDALYLTSAPAWPDDGALGRYRIVAHWPAVSVPRNTRELLELKRGRGIA